MKTKNILPAGICGLDLDSPQYNDCKGIDWENRSFDLWFTTSFGWCIPTVSIGSGRNAGRLGVAPRTYAVRVSDGQVVRIGGGPHVTERVIVYTTKTSIKRLQKFLDLRLQGAQRAGAIRDRIGSRRAQGQEERAAGNTYWRWNAR